MLIREFHATTGEWSERQAAAGEIEPVVMPLDPVSVVTAHVESVARSMGYSSAASCAGYRDSTVPQWAAEAAAFVAWRDAVWLEVFARKNEAPPETEAGIIALLPVWERPA